MDIMNKTVLHRVFGAGVVCGLVGNVISVRFGGEVRRFLFPDAFRDFLTTTDPQSGNAIGSLLVQLEATASAQRRRARQKEERRRLLQRLPLNPSAQAAFGFLYNDRQKAAADWRVSTGCFRSGFNRGQPRVPARLYPNSACLLTRRVPDAPEETRQIWGAFMVREDFIGPDCADGVIPAHARYRLLLPESAELPRFWDYFPGEGVSVRKWGPAEFRYFSNAAMARMLRDIRALLQGTDKEPLCGEFLDYFCTLNKISDRPMKSPTGP